MKEEAIARVGSHLLKNKYAQSISFGRDKTVSLMLLLEQLLASSARRVPSDLLFIVPTCRVHNSCALLERGLLILFSLCPKVIVVKPLMCVHLWLFCRKGQSFIMPRIFHSFLLGARSTFDL